MYAHAQLSQLKSPAATQQQEVGSAINVKFDRQATDALQVRVTPQGLAQVGVASVDRLNQQFNAVEIKRVFRPAGKHEARHRQWGLDQWYTVEFSSSTDAAAAAAAYADNPSVSVAEVRYEKRLVGQTSNVIFDDPLYSDQWHYHNTGSISGSLTDADIDLPAAHDVQTGSSSVIVSMVDSGVDLDHPDLVDALWVNEGEIPDNGIDDDNNGFVDDVHGYSHADDTGNVEDSDGHGTHTAGTVGARNNNGIGVAGVAGGDGTADSGVRLMINQTFGNTTSGGFAEAFVYGADNGAVISSNSWGYTSPGAFEQVVLDAIDYFVANAGAEADAPMEGGLVIFAAGNDSQDADWYPGYYEPTVAVAATGVADQKAGYSNFGDWVDISAPGGNGLPFDENDVLSTVPGGYGYGGGTSMAAPHASGVAALIVSENLGTGITNTQVRALLESNVDDIDAQNPGYIGELGTGRINANLAVGGTLDTEPPAAVTDLSATLPSASISQVIGTSVELSWTATGDDGTVGTAAEYDLRYSTTGPIDSEAAFESAVEVLGTPIPSESGTSESFTVEGLAFDTQYWFALRVIDDAGNESGLSNSPSATTGAGPSLTFDPSMVEATVMYGESTTESVDLMNDGDDAVTYSFMGFAARNLLSQPGIALNDVSATGAAGDYSKGTDPYAGTGNPVVLGAGGPDTYGYYWIDSNEPGGPAFSWFDISGMGTEVELGDDDGIEIDLPFSFPFYGEEKAGVAISSNGYLTFGGDHTDLSNDEIPSSTEPNDIIAAFWDDLDPADTGGNIYYYDDSENDRFIVQYTDVSHYPGPDSDLLTFQVMLYRDGSILLQYLDVADVTGSTVGVENADGTDGLQVAANTDYLENNLAVAIQPVPNYVSVDPASGTVEAGASATVDVTFDAADLLGGTYSAMLNTLVTDLEGTAGAYQMLPTELTVTGEPSVAVDPESIDFGTVFPDDTTSGTFTVTNDGTGVLEVTSITSSDAHYTAMPQSFTVPAGGGTASFMVEFAADELGSFPATLTLDTNAGEATVDVSAEVMLPPDVAVSPESIMAELLIGGMTTRTVTVANEGDSDLNYAVNFAEGNSSDATRSDVAAPAPGGSAPSGQVATRAVSAVAPGSAPSSAAPLPAMEATYQLDDGSSENSLGLGGLGDIYDMMWLNGFEVAGSASTITAIGTAWSCNQDNNPNCGTPVIPEGTQGIAVVYDDPNDDGDPTDAVLLSQTSITVNDPGTDEFTTVSIAPTDVEGIFFVGVLLEDVSPDAYPAPMDESSTYQGASWFAGTATGEDFNLEDLGANSTPPTELGSVDYPGNWLLRAGTGSVGGGNFPEWISAMPYEGTVAPGESVDLEVTLNAEGLDLGTYSGDLIVNSNDPDESAVAVATTLEVTSAPYPFALSPESIEATLETDDMATEAFTIANTTEEEQYFDIEVRNASGEGPNLANVLPEFERRVMQGVMASLSSNLPETEPTALPDLSGKQVDLPDDYVGLLEEVGVMAYSSSIGYASPFQDSFVAFDLGEPASLAPFGSSPVIYAGDFLLDDEESFVAIDENNAFISVDVETGATTPIGTSVPEFGDTWTELATDPTDGTLYASSSEGLHTIDPETGDVTAIGSFGLADEIMIAIAVDDAGNIFGHGINADMIYSIDPETGAATAVGSTGVDATYAQGMDFDPVTGQMYMAWYEGGGVGGLRTVNLETGATELIGPFQGDELGYLAIPSKGFVFVDSDLLSGTLAPMGDVTLDLNIDATGLYAGTYHAEVVVVSNEPGEPEGTIPVTLTVEADPIASLAPDSVDYGDVFVTDSSTATVTLTNNGRDVLNVSNVSIDGAGFVLDEDAATSFALPPMESRTFDVTFAPAEVQEYEASLVVESDDPENATVSTALLGTGLPSPEIAIDPMSIELQGYPGQTVEASMTMTNTGGSPLTCEMHMEMGSEPSTTVISDLLDEDFESGSLPEGWSRTTNGEGWLIGSDLSSSFWDIPDHTIYAASNDDGAGSGNDGSMDYLVTPALDLGDAEEVTLTFDSYYTGDYSQMAYVEVSTDGGSTWEVVHEVSAADEWTELVVDLSAYAGMSDVHVAFHADDSGSWASGWAVDNVNIQSLDWISHPPCHTMAPGESVEMPMTFDLTGRAPGTYEMNMMVYTNDPTDPVVAVPITLTVIESLSVTPQPADTLVHPNEAFTVPLMVQSMDGLDVFSYEFTLTYDSDLIEATGVETEGTLSEDVLIVHNVTEGQIQVSATEMESLSSTDARLFQIEGEGALLNVTFVAKEELGHTELSFTELFFNEGQPPASGNSTGIEVVPLYGDANLNVSVTAFDAGLILDHTVGLAEFGNASEVASEVSGNGSTTAFDAGLILDFTVGLIDCFPVAPGCSAGPASKRDSEARGALAWGSVKAEGAVTQVPLVAEDVEGAVRAFTLTMPFDEKELTLASVESALPEGWLFTHNVADGMLKIAAAGRTPVSNGQLATLTLERTDVEGAPVTLSAEGTLNELTAQTLKSVEVGVVPEEFALNGNYPNPFNPSTTISFDLPMDAKVSIDVIDVLGRRMLRIPAESYAAGTKRTVQLNASQLSSGLYFYRIVAEADGERWVETGRMTLVK